ncbi:MAG: hypothetical protein IVW53_10025 [Chloroflexi bacterium]|nr:hypothetical protein [Chloroflexota bacterium]
MHDVGGPEIARGIGTMVRVWWNSNMDARRSIGLLIAAVGCAVTALGIAASPVSLVAGVSYAPAFAALVGGVLGAAMGGYLRHRVPDHERAPLWALAYGASVVAILVATLGTAAVIRPTVRGIAGLVDAWPGVIAGGSLIYYVGALLWERDARRRRLAVLVFLAAWLMAGGLVARMSGDPWASIGPLVFLVGFGLFLVAFLVSLPLLFQDEAKPAA